MPQTLKELKHIFGVFFLHIHLVFPLLYHGKETIFSSASTRKINCLLYLLHPSNLILGHLLERTQ